MPALLSDTCHAHVRPLQGCRAAGRWARSQSLETLGSMERHVGLPTCKGAEGLPGLAWASRCLAASPERSAAPLSRVLRAPWPSRRCRAAMEVPAGGAWLVRAACISCWRRWSSCTAASWTCAAVARACVVCACAAEACACLSGAGACRAWAGARAARGCACGTGACTTANAAFEAIQQKVEVQKGMLLQSQGCVWCRLPHSWTLLLGSEQCAPAVTWLTTTPRWQRSGTWRPTGTDTSVGCQIQRAGKTRG